MSRTVNPVAHEAQRETFVTAAEDLVRSRGFAQVSVNDIIRATGASKGAFYHYFTGKSEVLGAVVERMVAQASAEVNRIVSTPTLDAVAKFRLVVHAMPAGQAANRELLRGILGVWFADDNAALREATRLSSITALRPALAELVAQGVGEGCFNAASAVGTADVLASLVLAMSDAAGRMWLARQAGSLSLADAVAILDSHARAIELVLGAPQGTFPQDRLLVRKWLR